MKRRDFIKTGLQVSGWTAAGSLFSPLMLQKALAQNPADSENFLFIHIPGGWDISLATDPWIQADKPQASDYFIEFAQSDLIAGNGYFVGPAMAPVKQYLNSMTIINGILVNTSDNGHAAALGYMTSGNGQGKLGAANVEIESKLNTSNFGILSNTSLSSGFQKSKIVSTGGFVNPPDISAIDFLQYSDSKVTELAVNKTDLLNYKPEISSFSQLLKQFQSQPNAGLNSEINVIAAAFSSGISHSGYIQIIGKNLDTHSSHAGTHLKALTEYFSSVANILGILSNTKASPQSTKSLLDTTTIIITSEFNRTPALNASLGKDHNPQTNSAIVISPHFKPTVFGGSHLVDRKSSPSKIPYLAANPIDATQMVPVSTLNNAFILRPEHVIASLMKSMGVAPGSVAPSLGKLPLLTKIMR